MTFIAVKDIANFAPLQAIVGQEVELTGTVSPTNATNKTIEWSLVSGNATIRQSGTRYYLTAKASENIVVRATVRNGIQG
jgi:endo-1,4-beta-xylanase